MSTKIPRKKPRALLELVTSILLLDRDSDEFFNVYRFSGYCWSYIGFIFISLSGVVSVLQSKTLFLHRCALPLNVVNE